MKTLHINLWAGPGTGKSTMAAGIFAALKWNKIDCELVSEYAKQIVWEESYTKLNNQIKSSFSGNQNKLADKILLTWCPISTVAPIALKLAMTMESLASEPDT